MQKRERNGFLQIMKNIMGSRLTVTLNLTVTLSVLIYSVKFGGRKWGLHLGHL